MVTVVLTGFSLASERMYYSITMSIRIGPICDESAWIRVISCEQSASIAVVRGLPTELGPGDAKACQAAAKVTTAKLRMG